MSIGPIHEARARAAQLQDRVVRVGRAANPDGCSRIVQAVAPEACIIDLALLDNLLTVIEDTRKLADARLNLLREHYGYDRDGIPRGKIAPCESPAEYGADCGKCLRCRSIYANGSLDAS